MAVLPVSVIPTFKSALIVRLRADANLGAASPFVPILYGMPPAGTTGDVDREFVTFGGTDDRDPTNGGGRFSGGWQTAALGGQNAASYRRVEERFVLQCAAVCVAPKIESQQKATERAFALFQYVVSNLSHWNEDFSPPLQGAARWAFVSAVRHDEGSPLEEFRAIVSFDIAVSARLTGAGSP